MSATIKDVAELSGVSVATVSKYINGGNLREKYRVRVDKAIRELNYSVNEVARNLKMNRSKMIGILASDITSVFITDIISHIQDALMEKGYLPLILDCQRKQETERKHLDALLRWNVDGIILFPGFNEVEFCKTIDEKGIPLVLVDQKIPGVEEDCVVCNNYESAFRMTEKLIEAGHKKIGLCRGPAGTYSADERSRGYEDAMAEHGLKAWAEMGGYTTEGGYQAAKRFLSSEELPTALLSCNYHMTIGLLRAFAEMNKRIPADISLAAFDKQEFDFAFPTSFSCVVQPMKEMGRYAAEQVIRKIENNTTENSPKVHMMEAQLIITDSIARI